LNEGLVSLTMNGIWCVMYEVRGAWYVVRSTRCKARGMRYEIRGTWYVAHLIGLSGGHMTMTEILLHTWFTQKWNELCFVNIRLLILYSSQAGWINTPCSAGIPTPEFHTPKALKFRCINLSWHAYSMCSWYVVWGMKCEVRSTWCKVRGTGYNILDAKHVKNLFLVSVRVLPLPPLPFPLDKIFFWHNSSLIATLLYLRP
jgi:hypothetical protein